MNTYEDCVSYTTICRLCMQRDGFMLGIFNHIQGKEKSIYKKIMDCTALEISLGDGLPNSICHRCLYKIEFCLEFRQQCFVSDATLRQINGISKQSIEVNKQPQQQQQQQQSENNSVVMVVDPNVLDYESDYDSEHSEIDMKNVFMCKYCDQAFTDRNECQTHEGTQHDANIPYVCTGCEMNFSDRLQYSAHLKNVHSNDKPYQCPQCEKTFARRSDLRKHTIVHTGIKPFTCHICFKSFSRNTNLSKHIRIHKGQKPFVCQSCPKTFLTKIDLTRHTMSHTGIKPFKCSYCPTGFERKDKLLRHQKRHFPAAGDVNNDKSNELRMMRENLGLEVPSSDKNDTASENLVVNIDPFQNIEEINTEPDLPPINDEKMEDDEDTPDHQQDSHVTGDQIIADVSELLPETTITPIMNTPDDKKLRWEPNERPFACHACPKAFMRKRELDRHIATHTGQKPFTCTYCEKRFGRKDKLIRHMRIHDVNKEHICNVCSASFNRKDGLAHHMKTHVKSEDTTVNNT